MNELQHKEITTQQAKDTEPHPRAKPVFVSEAMRRFRLARELQMTVAEEGARVAASVDAILQKA